MENFLWRISSVSIWRHFTIMSDHKQLQHLFSETRAIFTMVSAKIQRWALMIGGYDCTIAYKLGVQYANADLFSCLLLLEAPTYVPVSLEAILLMETLSSIPVISSQISRWTSQDAILSKVMKVLLYGWNHVIENIPNSNSYWQCRNELSLFDDFLIGGNRVIVPLEGGIRVMDLLYYGHTGTTRKIHWLVHSFDDQKLIMICSRSLRYMMHVKVCNIALHKRLYILGNFRIILGRGCMQTLLVQGKIFLI